MQIGLYNIWLERNTRLLRMIVKMWGLYGVILSFGLLYGNLVQNGLRIFQVSVNNMSWKISWKQLSFFTLVFLCVMISCPLSCKLLLINKVNRKLTYSYFSTSLLCDDLSSSLMQIFYLFINKAIRKQETAQIKSRYWFWGSRPWVLEWKEKSGGRKSENR